MKLTTGDSVKALIAFDDMDDVDTVIENALHIATDQLEADLRMLFTRGARTEYFLVPYVSEIGQTYFSSFRLNGPFVDVAVTPTYVIAAQMADFGSASLETDVSEYVTLDAAVGSFILTGYDISKTFLKVTYTSGFNADGNDVDLFAQSEVPAWLQRAAQLKTLEIMDSTYPQMRHSDENAPDGNVLRAQIGAILQEKIRYMPGAKKPIAG